eukprot:GHUV01041270.1.p1 GENE.GHUV01041270.1~~GHUV01041270.1.p1  ORF type:complete len:184 (+),score=37.66 GHUV01041270.1:446-997(+)
MEWEDTKENFVPVKQGHSAAALSTPLSVAKRSRELEEAKRCVFDDRGAERAESDELDDRAIGIMQDLSGEHQDSRGPIGSLAEVSMSSAVLLPLWLFLGTQGPAGSCRYIKWTQEQFAAQGSKSELQQVLELATKTLSSTKRHNNDVRFLRIWVQYVSDSPLNRFLIAPHLSGQDPVSNAATA